MRTLVGAADPEPHPAPAPVLSSTSTSTGSAFSLHITVGTDAPIAAREPYRTQAYVGKPVAEIEKGTT